MALTDTLTPNASKTRGQENFPVGSALIPGHLRTVIHAYYRFARMCDDVADDPSLPPERKLALLGGLDTALGDPTDSIDGLPAEMGTAARDLGKQLQARSIDLSVASDLLIAFRRDAENQSCRTWGELIDYCRFSACPVGRFLLALHKEAEADVESDALCCVLQILNHVQDAKDDYLALQRCYIPTDWLDQDGAEPSDLTARFSNPGVKATIGRVLDHTETLLDRASPLPDVISNRRLAAEAMACLTLAKRLQSRLRRSDPLADKVKLRKRDWIGAFGLGAVRLLRP